MGAEIACDLGAGKDPQDRVAGAHIACIWGAASLAKRLLIAGVSACTQTKQVSMRLTVFRKRDWVCESVAYLWPSAFR